MGDGIRIRLFPDLFGRFFVMATILTLAAVGLALGGERTDLISGKKPPPASHLSGQQSPYLLQHAADAVKWYPWSDDAFRKAREENKPIFLSIGYSSCHWCHVMREESFSDPAVAALLNESFVPVLVDREERPDIDSVYIAAAEVLNGSGGWPLNLMLTPERKPFYAATYIPREDLNGKPGLLRLLPQIAAAWKKNPADVAHAADQIVAAMATAVGKDSPATVDGGLLKAGFEDLSDRFDAVNGGFLPAPKFPSPHQYLFLLRYWKRTGDRSALNMVTKSLDSMRRGAIYDQIGSGFHRYSTDGQWRSPHFEKMLYDQALLAMAYTEAFQATGNERYRETAEATLDYCIANLRSSSGAFYSAQDADSAAGEGAFYLWTAKELKGILGAGAPMFAEAYGVTAEGNFPDAPVPDANLLRRAQTDEELAVSHGLPVADVAKSLATSRARLKAARASRPAPAVDTKILADWNGLMIAALSQAAQVFGEPKYERAARSAADFVLGSMEEKNGTLRHSHGRNSNDNAGTLDDYAFTIWGLLNLYETSFEVHYLQAAIRMEQFSIAHFWDEQDGGFFMTASGAEKLLTRPRTVFDSDKPSGNSVQLMNLVRLSRMTGDTALESRAEKLARAFASEVTKSPGSSTFFLSALGFQLGPSFEVVIAGDPSASDSRTMLRALRSEFVPEKVVLFRPAEAKSPITALAPFTEAQRSLRGKATAYVCTNYNCKLPTNDPQVMLRQLREK